MKGPAVAMAVAGGSLMIAFSILGAVVVAEFDAGDYDPGAVKSRAIAQGAFTSLIVLLAVLYGGATAGLWLEKMWGRALAYALFFPTLIWFPIGTVAAVFCAIKLTGQPRAKI